MTAETRRNILRYGIAIDLVILATGVGLLVPDAPAVLFIAFTAAVVLATWKGRWQGGLTALLLAVAAVWYFFLPAFPASRLAAFVAVSAVLSALVVVSRARKTTVAMVPAVVDELADVAPNVVAFEMPAPLAEAEVPAVEGEDVRAVEKRRRAEAKRRKDEEQQAARERAEAERVAREAREREEAERVAREREEAERVAREAREREEAERVAREAREREEAERVAREAREREEAERVAREAREAREREEAERVTREAREREEAERVAREAREREEAERVAREAREREQAERVAREREEAERLTRERDEAARIARETRERAAAERLAAEEELRRAEAERREAEAQAAKEREEAERVTREARDQLEAEKRAAEERLATEREALRAEHERKLAAERETLQKETLQREMLQREALDQLRKPAASEKPSLVDTLTGWFRRAPAGRSVNLNTRKIANNRKPTPPPNTVRRPAPAARKARNPRLLLLERRRGTADTVAPKLKQRGIDVAVVERWVDSVDELFRFRPDAMLLDTEHPEFDLAYKTITDQSPKLPIVLTGRSAAGFQQFPNVRYASFSVRPYDPDELSRLAETAMANPEKLLQQQAIIRTPVKPPSGSIPSAGAMTTAASPAKAAPESRPAPLPKPAAPLVVAVKPATDDEYEVICVACRTPFDALDADWCSCLTKERTLVCTNCLTCFCKALPAYKERFWVEAPPRLFERKTAEARRQQSGLPANPEPEVAKRPLVLCVEDDEEIQAIVQRVCSNLGYGFIYATNGQDGLSIARLYRPNLILSDAFMPKLDGREMCRLLKEEPIGAEMRMVVMTGLYTDTKYRSEAVKRFHVDDYIAKPVAITDLINLLQKHLEGVTGLPVQDDMFEQHRRDVEEHEEQREDEDDGIALADLLTAEIEDDHAGEPAAAQPAEKPKPRPRSDAYAVSCINCRETFDATKAEWCSCVGRDQTLACTHCSGCFCKAPASYKERFWMDAPPSLFERKMIGSKRNLGARSNPTPRDVKRPLILLVEDDENVQLIVRTVVTSMGYGFIAGANGQEGLSLAREYDPDLILSDAFMPKLDGREMCRLLKEDPATARSKAIIMTGLYTDRKYRNEALDYFRVDDYVAKPLAVDDLIKLFKKHLPQEVQAAS